MSGFASDDGGVYKPFLNCLCPKKIIESLLSIYSLFLSLFFISSWQVTNWHPYCQWSTLEHENMRWTLTMVSECKLIFLSFKRDHDPSHHLGYLREVMEQHSCTFHWYRSAVRSKGSPLSGFEFQKGNLHVWSLKHSRLCWWLSKSRTEGTMYKVLLYIASHKSTRSALPLAD